MVNTKGSLDNSQTKEKKVKVNQACNIVSLQVSDIQCL